MGTAKMDHGQEKLDRVVSNESYSLFQSRTNPHRWQVSYRVWIPSTKGTGSPAVARWRRKRFNAANFGAAQAEAMKRAGIVEIGMQDMKSVSVIDAFNMTLEAAKRQDRSRTDWGKQVAKFISWLSKNHPERPAWYQIDRSVITGYLKSQTAKAPNSLRLAMQPIVQTSYWMEENEKFPNNSRKLGIGNTTLNEPTKIQVTDVVALLNFMKEDARFQRWEAGVALAGLCGLSLQEVTRLTWDKVDLERGLVEISGKVKRKSRERVIPVCNRAWEALERAAEFRDKSKWKSKKDPRSIVPDVRRFVVTSQKGYSYGNDFPNYSRRIKDAFRAFNPNLGWQTKDLRNMVQTLAAKLGKEKESLWRQYWGHAAKDVSERHYQARLTSTTEADAQALFEGMATIQAAVVDHINAAVEATKGPREDFAAKLASRRDRPTDELESSSQGQNQASHSNLFQHAESAEAVHLESA